MNDFISDPFVICCVLVRGSPYIWSTRAPPSLPALNGGPLPVGADCSDLDCFLVHPYALGLTASTEAKSVVGSIRVTSSHKRNQYTTSAQNLLYARGDQQKTSEKRPRDQKPLNEGGEG